MTTELLVIGGGISLLILAALGGGIEIKELKVPQINAFSRVMCVIIGVSMIGLGVFLEVNVYKRSENRANVNETNEVIKAPEPIETKKPAPENEQLPPLSLVPQTISPSFDCSKGVSRVEKIICATPELAVLDLALANAYRDALAKVPEKKSIIRDAQKHWLKELREPCADAECLKNRYEIRMYELRSYTH